jgi:hypothetical protein
MDWYSQFIGDWNDYYGSYCWQKLPGGDHSALGDCIATLEIIKLMARSIIAEIDRPISSSISLSEAIEHGKEILSQ